MRWIVLFISSLAIVNAADILLLSTVASISHSRWYGKLAYLLAQNGHKVAVLDTDKIFFEHPNITHFLMEGGYGWLQDMEAQAAEHPDGLDSLVEAHSVWDNLIMVSNPKFLRCDSLLKSNGALKFMKHYQDKKFDLIIGDGFCELAYGFVHTFNNPPLIVACPYLEVITADYAGVFDNPSYVPFQLTSNSPDMNLIDRIKNTVYHLMNAYVIQNYNIKYIDDGIKDVFGPSTPGIDTIIRNNLALVMTGHSHVVQGSKPLPPSYIPIPGFHATPPDPLPKDIKDFLDGAKDGAILFSMGSNFKSILMSPEKREMFLSVFRNIPQRVIWKLELDNDTNIPHNVMIKKWLPQNDILGHPNIKAFISHGGLLGSQEAVYHGVPIIGIPIMFDQIHNMERLERHGVAIRFYYKNLNRKYISQKVDKILNDPSYQYNMKQLSEAFRDTPLSPQDKALYWIEYVLRNSKNKRDYLKPASINLTWYQRLLLDVAAIVALCLAAFYYTIKCILKCFLYLIWGRKIPSKLNVQKKKN